MKHIAFADQLGVGLRQPLVDALPLRRCVVQRLLQLTRLVLIDQHHLHVGLDLVLQPADLLRLIGQLLVQLSLVLVVLVDGVNELFALQKNNNNKYFRILVGLQHGCLIE